jgi:hydroxypyruvate isomerase
MRGNVMPTISRREAIVKSGTAALCSIIPGRTAAYQETSRIIKKGNLKQSAARWCYKQIPLADFCRAVAAIGLPAIDLLEENEWGVAKEHGLICAMGYGGGGTISDGLNVKANHDAIVKNFERSIPHAAQLGVPNLITFFGNRRGMSDDEATANCFAGLNRLKKLAEDQNVTICVELLNSKVDHKDYQGDRTPFGVEVIKAVGSPNVKLLYDIYHMQIMEGDVIRTIQKNHEYIAHFHTGGVPGRHELDNTQELNWIGICAAIIKTGFKGYVAHEFVPTRDPLSSLREAVALCDL